MESNLAQAFILKANNCNIETAYSFLHANQWDLEKALKSWSENESPNGAEKDDCVDKYDPKKLSRGISRATDNMNLVLRTRSEFAQNLKQSPLSNDIEFLELTGYSFILPDLNAYGEDFRKYLERDLIEMSTLFSLEQSGRLNWWTESVLGQGLCPKLWPLLTTGDGNCLLHAASLGIWGFHDRLLILREALHDYLDKNIHIESLYRRWRWQISKQNEMNGFTCTEDQWERDWKNIINMASTEPRNLPGMTGDNGHSNSAVASPKSRIYESLEEFHVLALAHVLRRPIIVVADVMLKDMNNEPFSPILFGGIYLPLECSPKFCHRSPLLLTYDMAHFSALVAMENSDKEKNERLTLIPLTDSEGMLLPVQFCVDPGPNFDWNTTYEQSFINSLILSEKDQIALIRKYLDVVDLSETENTTGSPDIDSEDEIERRYVEITDLNDGEVTLFSSKNRAAKQLQSVARQFGSIGKSMSKKLKKNFGSITKVAKPKQNNSSRNRMICAEMHAKRHENHEQMIKNYLSHMQRRFLQEVERMYPESSNFAIPEILQLQQQAFMEGPIKCINSNCDALGTVLTSYMCDKCYETQRNQELNVNTDSRFGTGRSKFYRDSDIDSYDAVRRLPVQRSMYQPDRTLYLSKSTFYYDNDGPENNNKETMETPRIEDISEIIDFDMKKRPPIKGRQRRITPTATITSYNKENFHPYDNSNRQPNDLRHIVTMDVTLSNSGKNDLGEIDAVINPAIESINIIGNRTPLNQNYNNNSNLSLNSYYDQQPIDKKYNEDLLRLGISDIEMRGGSLHYKQTPPVDILKLSNDINFRSKYVFGPEIPLNKTDDAVDLRQKHVFGQDTPSHNEVERSIKIDNNAYPHLQPCKTNNCANIASGATDFYCTDCWKKTQIQG